MNRTAIVVGSNGLVGSELLKILLESDYYRTVVSLARKYLEIKNDKLVQYIIEDYNQLDEYEELIAADDIYCCLGSTMKKAGSKEAFRKVDFDYPLTIAKLAALNDSGQFMLVSALGANPGSGVFYNKVKGEVEEAIKEVDFNSLHIFRPSLLLGDRQEKRGGESTAKVLMTTFSFAMVGPWKKYKPVQAKKVAQAMFQAAQKNEDGVHVHESDQIAAL